jgi:eukaryotic-like serine/threonine-protein kinase
MALRDLTPPQHSRLLELFDESLELSPEARVAWLTGLERNDPEFGPLLHNLLAAQSANQAEGFLSTGNSLARQLLSTPEADCALIGQQVGPYRVMSLLGQGGMGSVWLAERAGRLFTRKVALKLLKPRLMSRVMTERFSREREILANLSHPNIARLFDAGFTADGEPYLALEYVEGIPLTAHCDQRQLSIDERLKLFRQVLAAVQYAHAHLVIHCDLKPSNILVTADGEARLLDFGIAKPLTGGEEKETELAQFGERALTPEYAAPEQIAGAAITIAADVYALGVMLYELLTGQRPYRLTRDSRGALEEAILQAEPAAPSRLTLSDAATHARATTAKKLRKALRGDLDTIVLKSLRKSPLERYPTVSALSEAIGSHLYVPSAFHAG